MKLRQSYSNQTIATISHLLLAMIYYPDAFNKARQEIIRVIGTERLPTFNDRVSLPYGMHAFNCKNLTNANLYQWNAF